MRASPHAFAEKGNFCVPGDNSGLAPALVCVAKKMFIRPFHAPFFPFMEDSFFKFGKYVFIPWVNSQKHYISFFVGLSNDSFCVHSFPLVFKSSTSAKLTLLKHKGCLQERLIYGEFLKEPSVILELSVGIHLSLRY